MRTETSRRGYIWALGALCSVFISLGTVRAADRSSAGGAVVESGDVAGPHSIFPDRSVIDTEGSPDLLSPTLGICAGPVVPFDGSASSNGRAPTANFAAARGHYLILQSELAAAGITGTATISGIGWRYAAAPGVAATAPLKVYLENANAATTANAKSATWATAIATMSLVHNASTTLPNAITPYDIAFSLGSFTYTGGALYVAFDWGTYTGTLSTTTLDVSCNSTAVASRERQANSAAVTLGALSALGPETRLTATVNSNDAGVVYVISLGSLAQPLVGPQTVQAVVTNKGASALTNLPVTLSITGAETFTNMQNVASLAACGGTTTVSFAPFTPSTIGSDTVTITVPPDDVAGNNTANRPLDETFNLYSYKHPGTTASGGVGVNSPNTADFVAKFTTTAAAKVSAVNLEFFAASATTYRVAIYPDSGSGTPGLVPLYEDAVDRTVAAAGPVTITLPTPIAVGPGTFFAGVQQTNTTNASISFDNETPIRSGAFYLAVPHPATAWFDFAPGNNFKLNIGVTLVQCSTAAECNDNNACTDDACTNGLCLHTNNTATSCDGNPCSDPDQCLNGTCIPGPNPCSDSNACTIDLCGGGGSCTYNVVDCNDNDPCTNDSCDPSTGCAYSNNTSACTDNNPCTIGDVCSGGVCLPGALPAPVRICNNGAITIPDVGAATPYPSAIVVTGHPSYLCSVTVELSGFTHTYPSDVDVMLARLTGSNALIMSDVGGFAAITGVNLTLSDSAVASLPSVGPLVSGTFKPTNIGTGDVFPAPAPAPTGGSALSVFTGTNPNGTWDLWVDAQFAGDSGSISGWCINLVSICSTATDCNDGNPCTNDFCTNTVCTHTNNTAACTDGNACTLNDTCSGGACVGGAPQACDDGDACTANNCNTGTGQCEYPAIVCNDNNTCTDDGCHPATGCVYTANNNPCTDNSVCTTPDVCQNGVCVGQNPVVCTPDANVCTTEACNPATGSCASTNNTNACDDGNACTTGDICGPTFSENFDAVIAPSLPAAWSTSATGSGIPWASVNTSSDTVPNSAFGFDGPGPLAANEYLITPPINVATAAATLTFRNRWSFESATGCFDAGVLEIAIGGGAFTDIVTAGGSFVSGGYTGTVSASFGNPLASRSAWCSASAGYPAYLTTVVNLPAVAAGRTIQLRWRIGTDTTDGASGQNIDSIVVLDGTNVCHPGTPITAPPETQSVTVAADKVTYSWSGAAFATRYDVLRGSTGALPVGPGGGDESLTPCFGSLAGTTLIDTDLPASGAGYWYLSRGINACGTGTYGFQGLNGVPGAPRISSTTCP